MFALMPWTTRRTELLPRTENLFEWVPEEFERLWNRFAAEPMMEITEPIYRWGTTMEERENEIVVRSELPGFTPEEVRVELLGGRLTIEAEHKAAQEEGERRERERAHMRRTVTLPSGIAAEKVEAVYRNGVLEVHVPRTPEAMPRRIEVKA